MSESPLSVPLTDQFCVVGKLYVEAEDSLRSLFSGFLITDFRNAMASARNTSISFCSSELRFTKVPVFIAMSHKPHLCKASAVFLNRFSLLRRCAANEGSDAFEAYMRETRLGCLRVGLSTVVVTAVEDRLTDGECWGGEAFGLLVLSCPSKTFGFNMKQGIS